MGACLLFQIFVVVAAILPVKAVINLGSIPSILNVGRTYNLSWTATENYTYNLWLVLDDPGHYAQNGYDWTKVATLVSGLLYPTLNGNYSWTVPSNLSTTSDYAIWFGCFPNENDTTTLYSITTPYFLINNSTAAITSTGGASSSSSSSPTSTAAASTTTSAAVGAATSGHHSGLSGGAIAGIVIGIVVALLLVLLGAILLLRRHRSRAAAEHREAAARAERLAPVTKQSFNGYEMQARSPNLDSVTIEHPTITTTTTTRFWVSR